MPLQSNKLTLLLRLLWHSPIFGNSFPRGNEQAFFEQFNRMYPAFIEKITPILQLGAPEASGQEIQAIVGQLAPKSLAFCAAISAGEVEDEAGVLNAAVVMGLVSWIDQSMDRGDEAMLAAVHLLTNPDASHDSQNDVVRTRFAALRRFNALIRQAVADPQDIPFVTRALETDVLVIEAGLRTLSRELLLTANVEAFWQTWRQKIAQNMIDCSGLMTVTSLLYSVKRCTQPELPSLAEIHLQPELSRLIREPFNAAVRVFDDAGDWQVDAALEGDWGVFNINLFNQSNDKLTAAFLSASGLESAQPLFEKAQAALALPAEQARLRLVPIYLTWVRQQTDSLSGDVRQRYAAFLVIATRVMEAGLVNMLGDIFLSEQISASALDKDLFGLIAPTLDFSQWAQEDVR